jgi:hypothetical protein
VDTHHRSRSGILDFLFKRMLSVILAVQFEQVEGIQEDLAIVPAGMQPVEIGPARPFQPKPPSRPR